LRESPTVGGWLKTVATNLSLNHLSRYRSRWRFFSEMVSASDEDESPVEIPAPDTMNRSLDEADYRRMLERALQKLPGAQRVPLVLYHFEDYSYEEIAEKLKVSLSKVKTDIFRARETLRRKLNLQTAAEDPWSDFKPQHGTASSKASKPPGDWRVTRELLMA